MGQNLIPQIEDDPTRVLTSPSTPHSVGLDSSSNRAAIPARQLEKSIDSEAPTRPVGTAVLVSQEPFPQPGETFQGFDLLSELGRGGMGRVFLARQRAMAYRMVVLKVGPHLSRECQKLAKLQHPNIVPVYSFHQEGTIQAVCMPYRGPLTLAHLVAKLRTEDLQTIDGKALTTMIEECRRGREPSVSMGIPSVKTDAPAPPPAVHPAVQAQDRADKMFTGLRGLNYIDAVLTIIRQVADGLRFAHGERIVHCDLKPANVLISDDGCPQLIDFGIAYDKSNFAVEQFRVGGTRPYMSPEQLSSVAAEHLHYDERSDLYGLGVILYELVTGELPFEPNFVSTPAAIENDCMNRFKAPTAPRMLNPNVPLAVESIIEKCLAPDVVNRYQSARELQEDLDRQLARRPLRYAANSSKRELISKWVTRNRLLLVALGFAAITAAAAVGVEYRDARRIEHVRLQEALVAGEPFTADLRDAQFYFGVADTDPAFRNRAMESARSALNHFQAWDDENWFLRPGYQSLPEERLHAYRQQAAGLMLLLANASAQEAIRENANPVREQQLRTAQSWNQRAERTFPNPEGSRALWLQRAYLAGLRGDIHASEELTRHAVSIPREASDAVAEGRQLMAENRLGMAQQVFKEAIQRDPRNFWAVFFDGACAQRMGQDRDAIASYNICGSLQPGFVGTHFNRGQALARSDRFTDAESDFDKVIELRPDWADAFFFRALTREALKRYPESISDLNRALELGFTPTSVYLVRSRLYARMDNKEAAARDRAEGLKVEPKDERGWLARAQAKLIDDASGALNDYDQALALNSRSLKALQGRGHLLMRAGKNEEALTALSRIIEINPESPDAWSGRGVLHARLNKREEALRDAREALRLSERPPTKYQVAGIYALTSRTNPEDQREALAMLDAALRAGFGFEYLDKDRDLDPIRKDIEFTKTIEAARAYRKSLK